MGSLKLGRSVFRLLDSLTNRSLSWIAGRALCLLNADMLEHVAVEDGRVHNKSPWLALNRDHMQQRMTLIGVRAFCLGNSSTTMLERVSV